MFCDRRQYHRLLELLCSYACLQFKESFKYYSYIFALSSYIWHVLK